MYHIIYLQLAETFFLVPSHLYRKLLFKEDLELIPKLRDIYCTGQINTNKSKCQGNPENWCKSLKTFSALICPSRLENVNQLQCTADTDMRNKK